METEQTIRTVAASFNIDCGTNAPYQMVGDVYIEKIGFGQIPVVGINIIGKEIESLVNIARQVVFREVVSQGVSPHALQIRPTVCKESRKRKFVDCNESSPSFGKNKMGHEIRFHFEIKKEHLGCFEWDINKGKVKYASAPHG